MSGALQGPMRAAFPTCWCCSHEGILAAGAYLEEPPRQEEPPSEPHDAWCIRCGGPTRQGPRGCVACAAAEDELEREGRLS